MKAIVIRHPGGPEQLKLEEVPTLKIKPGWSLVNIKGFGINHSEIFTKKGESPSVHFPRILGIECAGLIKETTDPERLPVGQKVISIMGEMGRAFDGSYAEYALLPNRQLYPVQTDLPWATLAALPESYYTAYGSFLNLKIRAQDTILVRGGTSGVGIAFLRLVKAKYPQVQIAGSSRSLAKEKMMKKAGYDQIIVDQDGHLKTAVKFSKIFELIGPKVMTDSFKHLQEGGILCETGLLGGQWTLTNFDPIEQLPANSYLTSFNSANVDEKKINQMLTYVKKYRVQAQPEKVFDLAHVSNAHRYLESKHSFGKVVVVEK